MKPSRVENQSQIPRFLTALANRRVVVAILAVHAGLLAWGAWRHSPTIDEVAYLPAGISHWTLGRFDLFRVNPPLVRLVAAVPVLAAGARTDWSSYSTDPRFRSDSQVGRDFLRANGERSFLLFSIARSACIPFSLLGAIVCYRWAKQLYGASAGVLAVTLWCFCPNILAHGQLITPDVGASSLGLLAAYTFWHWLKRSSWDSALAAGLSLGAAQLTKTTWLILLPLWLTVWGIARLTGRAGIDRSQWAVEGGQVSCILAVAICVLNIGYGWEGSFRRLKDFQFVSQTLGGVPVLPIDRGRQGTTFREAENRFQASWLGKLPVPLPANYVQGIDVQKRYFEHGLWSYLRGQWKIGGWWYFHAYAALVKVPLGTWALVALALVVRVVRARKWTAWTDEAFLVTPAIVLFVFISCNTGFTRHLRYTLPVFPFLFIWTSGVMQASYRRVTATLIGGALSWSVVSSLWVFPHSLSYFNELAGGPAGGHQHLLFSNIDWGQDMLYLRRWVRRHPHAQPLHVSVIHPSVSPAFAGIQFSPLPRLEKAAAAAAAEPPTALGPNPGWHVVSVLDLQNRSGDLSYFQRFAPRGRIGYSMYVYHITLEEANLVRRQLNLPLLSSGGLQ